nr:alpha amylase C-terminal domain-containing protein [uncultured Desulfobacter sp.]
MKKCSKDPFWSDPSWTNDPYISPFKPIIRSRFEKALAKKEQLKNHRSWAKIANYHEFFGLHRDKKGWVFREWAPNATKMFILTPANNWEKSSDWQVKGPDPDGIFEARFPDHFFSHEQLYRLKVVWDGGEGDRIPTAATRVIQDNTTYIFNAQVWAPQNPYQWQAESPDLTAEPLLIYEAHAGMALEEGRVGTWREFADHILPKVVESGYNTLQMMAIQEHPYYGSFGYHVSSFFAPSSRFGTPDDFKYLVDRAHQSGIRVLMDIVHSHSVKNEVEGLSRFDGSMYQFFHDLGRGDHTLWDSRCFDYGKQQVLIFLLSNLRYFLEQFRVDGFRFDGITSMLYADHGLGRAFTGYQDYFGDDVDEDALSYLYAANDLVHEIHPNAVTIAEDVSGYPGLAAPTKLCGTGFDFRFSMGVPDYWIKLLKEVRDERWHMGGLWYELTRHRDEERTISYVECHDQALVGDKTIMMHLMGGKIYDSMEKSNTSITTNRAVALHKMIRLITLACAHKGYLNFMGNEFGHPEWIDFPSPANGYSYHHARRLWSLKYDKNLYFPDLFAFDKQMVTLAKQTQLFTWDHPRLLHIHEDDKILAFERSGLIFVFNFHPEHSFGDYLVHAPAGKYKMCLDTDESRFGGLGRLNPGQEHFSRFLGEVSENRHALSLYLPNRCALVLWRV